MAVKKKRTKRRPKTVKPQEQARAEIAEVISNPDGTNYGLDWPDLNKEQRLMRQATMLNAIQLGAPRAAIRATMESGYGCTSDQSDWIWREVVRRMREDFNDDMPYVKAQAAERIKRDIAEMRSLIRKPWSKILAHERFLAKIEGTEAPIKVAVLDVNEAMRDNLASSLASSTDDRLRMLIAKGKAMGTVLETNGNEA